jgi:hypothetical protein
MLIKISGENPCAWFLQPMEFTHAFCDPWYLKNKTNTNETMKIYDSY